jgi:hypothetical protein
VWCDVGSTEGSEESVVGLLVGREMGALVGGWLGREEREERGDKVGVAGNSVGDALGKSLGAVGCVEGDGLGRNESVERCIGWLIGVELAGKAVDDGLFACEVLGDRVGVAAGSFGELMGNGLDVVVWFMGEALGSQLGRGLNVALILGLKFGDAAFNSAVWEPTGS